MTSNKVKNSSEYLAKAIVFKCIRETILEDMHANGTPIGNKEMKELMIEFVNKVYTFLWMSQKAPEALIEMIHSELTASGISRWNTPQLDAQLLGDIGLYDRNEGGETK